ncbi:coiled-coil domain-containing protein 171 [Pleuronectes platessa]|uniref:coiled-coil domain-containing protein 171 n=1 Tax=Pleuronectes platessa TaxID=8262 RepID=UPI00232A34EA|nr:coiled-coil domain-containing protein 171 [Pleuronectes platessa]
MKQRDKQTGGGEESEDEDEERRRGRRRVVRGRRAASEGREWSEETGRLRWRINELEKEKLELTSTHNQELCKLQAALARFRSSVERGEAQRVELQYQLTVSQRDAERVAELSRDKHSLTEQAAELHQTVHDLQKALDITRQAREEDQHALQQEVEERDKLIQSFSSENQQLRQLLEEQEEILQESETRIAEVKEEAEKEAEVNRRQAGELKYLMEREERSRREKEASDQRGRSLESNIEAERAAHLESKFNSELIQLRVRDLEAVVAVERSGQQEAQSSLELLRSQFREVERAYTLERERSSSTGQALERLQAEYDQCKCDLTVSLKTERTMTSDLTEKLEEEKKRLSDIRSQLEQAVKTQSDTEESHMNFVQKIRETLHQHINTGKHTQDTGCSSPAMHDGKPSVELLQLLKTTLVTSQLGLEETEKQVQDLLLTNQRLQEENHNLQQLSSDQSRQIQVSVKLEEEVTRLRQESSDWSTQSRGLQAELQREREERAAEIQKIMNSYENESKARLSFLHCLYQRLLAGCVLLTQPHSILGNFTWTELCDVISEQVDRLSSDLHKANDKVSRLKSACEKKSVCVRELQRHQQRALSRLEEGVRRREEAWSNQLTQLQNELQVSRSQCDSLRDHVSSFELHRSSMTSDLARLRGLLSKSRRESASLLSACTLLAGAMKHTHHRLWTLCEQKRLLCRRLVEREVLEEEVRRLANALGDEEEEEEERRGKMAVRRWRRSVWAVLAVRRWCTLAKKTTVLLRVERGGGAPAVCVCGETATATRKIQKKPDEDHDGDEGREGVCARWLRSKCLSSIIMSCMADLQGALAHTDSAPPKVMAAAHSGLSRLLDHLLTQSDTVSCRLTPPQLNLKALVSTLQQHFLLFSQRLHSAEVERRSLRLEAANVKRGRRREGEDTCKTVPAERFHSVCMELREALTREREAQSLIQEQTDQLHTLQLQEDAHTREQSDTQRTLSHTTQVLSSAQQEVSRKERSLRILGKHLASVQSERKQLEERLQRAEDELRDATRHKDELISDMKAAETSDKKVTVFPDETSLVIDVETPVPLTGQEAESKPPGPSHHNQAPSASPLTKPPEAKMKEKKTTKKKNRGHVKSGVRK